MSCNFILRNEIPFEEIKPFGFFYEYNKENDAHLIVSKRQVYSDFDSQYHKNEIEGEHYNYLLAHMGPNGGFRGFTTYGGNDVEFLIYCLTKEMNIRLISEHQMDTTFFIDAVTDEFNLHEMIDTDEFDTLYTLLWQIVKNADYVDVEYGDLVDPSDWLQRNKSEIKKLIIESGLSLESLEITE
jgi:hypothetical protein